jgi:DNA-binding CsgD family transcriptional regulator
MQCAGGNPRGMEPAASHELIETLTDPLVTTWFVDDLGNFPQALSFKRRIGRGDFRESAVRALESAVRVAGLVDAAVCARMASSAGQSADLDRLSRRQQEVYWLLRAGMQNKEIAAVLGTAVDTVRKQTIAVYERLGVHGRVELLVPARV